MLSCCSHHNTKVHKSIQVTLAFDVGLRRRHLFKLRCHRLCFYRCSCPTPLQFLRWNWYNCVPDSDGQSWRREKSGRNNVCGGARVQRAAEEGNFVAIAALIFSSSPLLLAGPVPTVRCSKVEVVRRTGKTAGL